MGNNGYLFISLMNFSKSAFCAGRILSTKLMRGVLPEHVKMYESGVTI